MTDNIKIKVETLSEIIDESKYKNKIPKKYRIISAFMSKPYDCLSLEELNEITRIDKNELKVLLHYLYKEGLIRRHWRRVMGKRQRIYCLDKEKVLNVKS